MARQCAVVAHCLSKKMNADKKSKLVRELESKLNEFDSIFEQLAPASRILSPLMQKHIDAGARVTNRSREGKDISQQLSVLRKVFCEYPGALTAISDITQSLSRLALEIDSLLNQL